MSQEDLPAINAQARLHHAWLLGLQLMVSTRCGPEPIGEWMFRLFRRQHLEKFLSSFDKLGLTGLPHAVACAQYHVLSNQIGGVGVEYMAESDRKAWVRFRYPRWMYDGPVICGVPVEVSRGFLRGWYAHNGVSLGNPRLGFVCVSEDMTGEFGFCGYFREFDRDLAEDERLQFARGEMPPPFDESTQPQAPPEAWTDLRLAKANRNYALDYIRNGLTTLADVIGLDRTLDLGKLSARLIGLQYYRETAAQLGCRDGGLDDGAAYLARMFAGMGDTADVVYEAQANPPQVRLTQTGQRVIRGLHGDERNLVLACWSELWTGAMDAQRRMQALARRDEGDRQVWTLTVRSGISD